MTKKAQNGKGWNCLHLFLGMETINWLIFYEKKYVDVEMIMDQMKKQSVVISCHVESCLNIWEQTDRLGMNEKK